MGVTDSCIGLNFLQDRSCKDHTRGALLYMPTKDIRLGAEHELLTTA